MLIVIDYGMGNLNSIINMFKKIGVKSKLSSDHSEIKEADKLVLPGVGAFDEAINNLTRLDLIDILNEKVLDEKTPILGICLGIQLFTKKIEEGDLYGPGWVDSETRRFKFNEKKKETKSTSYGMEHN